MKKSFVLLLHVGFWTCYLILICIMLAVSYRSSIHVHNQEFRIINVLKTLFFFSFIPSVASYVFYYFILFPKFLQQKKFFLTFLFGVLVSTGAAVIGFILLRYFIQSGNIIDMDPGGESFLSAIGGAILTMTFIGLVCGIIALVIKGFITWVNEIRLKEELTKKTHEMEMALVKLQLDPHLLFNTINNIDALILKDAAAASAYLNKLSDIMRFIVYETKTDRIFLAREIEYIDKYIALQKIRTANETYASFTVTGCIGNKLIAPMVFIPFIENAFKHAANKKLENAITVNISVKDETTQLSCENKFDSKPGVRQANGGLGNELIERRLKLLYAENYILKVLKTDVLYSINLTIPNG
jgi:two-component system, LytTR family, sensor kinase